MIVTHRFRCFAELGPSAVFSFEILNALQRTIKTRVLHVVHDILCVLLCASHTYYKTDEKFKIVRAWKLSFLALCNCHSSCLIIPTVPRYCCLLLWLVSLSLQNYFFITPFPLFIILFEEFFFHIEFCHSWSLHSLSAWET